MIRGIKFVSVPVRDQDRGVGVLDGEGGFEGGDGPGVWAAAVDRVVDSGSGYRAGAVHDAGR